MERVDGNRVGVDLPERQGQVDQVLVAFSHADDASGTDFKAGSPRMMDCGQAVLKGVRAADRGVIGLAGVEIMIDPVHTGGF